MGLLVEGIWHDQWYDTKSTGGKFVRKDAAFRNWITSDGSAGSSGKSGFKAESGRYHLYVSHACPWAHRTMIFRTLKGLEDHIDVSVVDMFMGANGWEFSDNPGTIRDPIFNAEKLYQIYLKADPSFTGRVTVPVLWDKETATIVSNESSEIIRMFNSAFNTLTGNSLDFYPQALRESIDAINEDVYHNVNNGVYKSGFATKAEAYEEAVTALFKTLDALETILSATPYLAGDRLTEADWRLFTTLLRFDPVYVSHFKCNIRRIEDYPALSNYLRALYQAPGVAGTVNMDHIKGHYYRSHETINPTRIVPLGPEIDLNRPHNRPEVALI
ncbi:MAG: glutathione S-transferase family protein [Rhizobiales bacterium]|nr:glutathione S-transferase family protein [Hyphomicrobiales bacterium]